MVGMPLPPGLPLAIGSLPHVDAGEALDVVMRALPLSPHWPQLPRRSFLERMEYQFSGSIPGVVVDEASEKIVVDTGGEEFQSALERFWERVLAVESGAEPDHFALAPAFAPGLYALESRLAGLPRPMVVKGQCTGPLTLGMRLMTSDGRASLFDDALVDVVVKAVACHARWQARRMARLAAVAIVSVDEPMLSSYGSTALITVSREQAVGFLAEAVRAIHAEGALACTHCCGNTDWTIPIDAGMDILSFDAYSYADKLSLYSAAISRFLASDGILAWGIVPSSAAVRTETAGALRERLLRAQAALAGWGVDPGLLAARTIVTPSCGTGSLTVDEALRVYDLLSILGGQAPPL